MSDARSRFARLVANPRRDAGYTILEAMLPCVAFLVLGTLIAGGLWNPTPPSVAGASPVSATASDTPDPTLLDPKSGNSAQKRPVPGDAERRGVYVTREYENRLIANPNRGGTASHGVPGSDFTGNGSNDILVTQPMATNLIDGTDPGGGYGTVEVWTLLSSGPVLALGSLNQNDLFGLSAKSAGDLDGDGAAELVIGAPLEHGDSGLEGAVYVHSGSDGQLLMVISGEEWEYLGRTVAGASDHDADGQWDIAASSWVYDQGQPKGMVSIHSGSDGALIRTYTSALPDDGFGYEVVSLGDLDADADSELAIPATLAPGDPRAYAPATGRLYIFEGAVRAASPEHLSTSDAALTIMNPDPLIDHFGVLVELCKDEDGDGVLDLLVTSIVDPYSSAETTAMQIYSSASGDLLWPVSVGGTGSGRDGDQLPATDDDGNPILYSHYTSGLGVLADATRDLRVEEEDLMLVADAIGSDAAPGNPISGDVSLSGIVDLPDVNMVVTEIGNHSIIRNYIEDTGRLTGRWNALKPYQFGDYVLEVPGRVEPDGRGSGGGSGGGSPSDPVYPKPDPSFPSIGDQQWGGGVPGCDGYIRHPVCGIVPACFMNCCGADDCSGGDPLDNSDPGGGVGGPDDSNFNGIPDDEECGGSNPPAPTAECPDPCGDDDGDGIPNQYDCDSDCFDDRYAPLGADGQPCDPCGDDDGDGIPNQSDTDADGNGVEDCAEGELSNCISPDLDTDGDGVPDVDECDCKDTDDDGTSDADEDDDCDGIPNRLDCDSDCYEGDPACCDADPITGVRPQDDPESVCSDGLRVNITVHRPKSLDPNETPVSDEDELDIGVQLFENFDNDDRDGLHDWWANDMVVDGEDDMCRVEVSVPASFREGTLTLSEVSGAGGGSISLWRQVNKTVEFDTSTDVIQIPADLAPGGTLTLWMEGLSPGTQQRSVSVEATLTPICEGGASPDPSTDKIAVTVLGVESVQWLANGQNGFSATGGSSSVLDHDPLWPNLISHQHAVRYVPGRRYTGSGLSGNLDTVLIEVKLTAPAVEPISIFLRAFDMDEPIAFDNEIDDEQALGDNDNFGNTPSQTGAFVVSGTDKLELVMSANSDLRTTAFKTTMQPGDNFRVAAAFDEDFVDELGNPDYKLHTLGGGSNIDKQFIVDEEMLDLTSNPLQSRMRGHEQYSTPTLVVWRYMHIEVDSMGEVQGNTLSGHIIGLNTGDSNTATRAYVDVALGDGSADGPGQGGRFQGGSLVVAGGAIQIDPISGSGNDTTGDYVWNASSVGGLDICQNPLPFSAYCDTPSGLNIITGTVTRILTSSGVELVLSLDAGGSLTDIDPALGTSTIEIQPYGAFSSMIVQSISIADSSVQVDGLRVPVELRDDDGFLNGTDLPNINLGGINSYFRPACVYVVAHPDGADDGVPFLQNFPDRGDGDADLDAPWHFDNAHLQDNSEYWCSYMLTCFQWLTIGDNDPNSESAVLGQAYLNGRGLNIYLEALLDGGAYSLNLVVAHEVGHLFGATHEEGGIMGSPPVGSTFNAVTIARIRGTSHP